MNERPIHLVAMGVAGSGKSTIGEGVAEHFGLTYAEGDALHSDANRKKMGEGHPLDDEDRCPWLRSLRDWMTAHAQEGNSTVVACSALRRAYRDILREAVGDVFFVHLALPEDVNIERLTQRQGHYMATGMLQSQLDTLEALDDSEDGIEVLNVGTCDDVVMDACAKVSQRFGDRLPASEPNSS